MRSTTRGSTSSRPCWRSPTPTVGCRCRGGGRICWRCNAPEVARLFFCMSRHELIAFRRSLGRTPPLDRMTARVRGLDLAVWTSPPVPSAPPLLLVNGGMLYDHSLLWPSLSPLARGRQVILYDQRGRGASQPPPDPLAARIEDDAEDVGALRRALGIRQWDVLGHSWGGGIAMLGALRDQAGTRRLITVDAVGPTSSWMPLLHVAALDRVSAEDRATL